MTHVVLDLADLRRRLPALRSGRPEIVVLVDVPTEADAVAALLDLLESRPGLDGVVTCGPVPDTLKVVDAADCVIGTSDRDHHRRLDWPQAYRVTSLPEPMPAGDTPDALLRAVLLGGGAVFALDRD